MLIAYHADISVSQAELNRKLLVRTPTVVIKAAKKPVHSLGMLFQLLSALIVENKEQPRYYSSISQYKYRSLRYSHPPRPLQCAIFNFSILRVDFLELHCTESQPKSNISVEQQNALSKANSYLSFMAFSHSGLIEQLEYEGFSTDDSTYAADNCGADWDAQALAKAKSYLSTMAFSHSGLIDQLAYEGFTNSQATYGADNCGADWNEQAEKAAANYLSIMSFSREGLIEQLQYEGYTYDQAAYGVTANGF